MFLSWFDIFSSCLIVDKPLCDMNDCIYYFCALYWSCCILYFTAAHSWHKNQMQCLWVSSSGTMNKLYDENNQQTDQEQIWFGFSDAVWLFVLICIIVTCFLLFHWSFHIFQFGFYCRFLSLMTRCDFKLLSSYCCCCLFVWTTARLVTAFVEDNDK